MHAWGGAESDHVYVYSEEVGSVCGCVRNSVYVFLRLYHDVMAPRRANGAEHVAVEFWSGSGRPLKCLRTLPLQFLKSLDG